MHFLDLLTFEFQDYFRCHLKRGLTLLVEASVPDLFRYMKFVLSSGRYRQYADTRFLSNPADRRKLRECIIYVLTYLIAHQDEGPVGFVAQYSNEVSYFVPQIRDGHRYRLEISHLIFNRIAANGDRETEAAEIIHELNVNNVATDFANNVLDTLLDLNCLTTYTSSGAVFIKIKDN